MTIHAREGVSLSITRPPGSTVDYVQIRGNVDLADSPALGLAARALIDADASLLYVDLGSTTLMSSPLVAFLVHISGRPGRPHRPMVLCRPTPMALRIIKMTGLDLVASIRQDLPPLWPEPGPAEPGEPPLPERPNQMPKVFLG
ncbi:MAG: STAS domain-containing protein [Blastococcus sp.]